MLEENKEAEESRAESMDDMTAAATAPMPMIDTYVGVRNCRAMGRIEPAWPRLYGVGKPYVVEFQSGRAREKIVL